MAGVWSWSLTSTYCQDMECIVSVTLDLLESSSCHVKYIEIKFWRWWDSDRWNANDPRWGLAESAFGGDLESEVKSSVLFCFVSFVRNLALATVKTFPRSCEISSSHGGEYEAQNLLGCTAVFLIECRHSFKNTAVHPRRFWAFHVQFTLCRNCINFVL
jgi:hypothetical protein